MKTISLNLPRVEVFKTDVREVSQARRLVNILQQHFPSSKINFDLDDCDRILRVEGEDFVAEQVALLLGEKGFMCTVLE